ncbi:type I polyketide synthase, partial [Streptomyces amakusaensis]
PTTWPPTNTHPINLTHTYETLHQHGYTYGPAFQGLVSAWNGSDGELFAEIALPEEQHDEAARFTLHPALLDAALHILLPGVAEAGGRPGLPFSWSRVTVHTAGATAVRVRLVRTTAETGLDEVSLALFDQAGTPVATVGALLSREVSAEMLRGAAATQHESLFQVEWTAVPVTDGAAGNTADWAILGEDGLGVAAELTSYPDASALRAAVNAGTSMPPVVLVQLPGMAEAARASAAGSGGVDLGEAARTITHRALELAREWVSEAVFGASQLVLVARDAVPSDEDAGLENLALSGAWGIFRSAATENPGRFAIVDLDASEASARLLPAALAAGDHELVIRDGVARAPRLAKVRAEADAMATPWDGDGTVLVTGGTGGLGALLARHLVTEHGVRHLLLVSRRGPQAPGATDLTTELTQLGADITIAACDVTDRTALAELLTDIPDTHPLTAVVHTAGILDDSIIASMTGEQLDRVLRPKVNAAWNLHQLTADRDLSAFIIYSSVSGILGPPGQANYAAGNAFLNALAQYRRSRGLRATSLAWGLWDQANGMIGHLDEADRKRVAKGGVTPMSEDEGMALFDTAVAEDRNLLAPVRFDMAALRALGENLPPLLRGLVRATPRRGSAVAGAATGAVGGSLAERLSGLDSAERETALVDLVRGEVAAVLGHSGFESVEQSRAFNELGFDSLSAVEFRNRLNALSGLRLPATLVFDYPTPAAVAGHLAEEIPVLGGPSRIGSLSEEIDRLEASLAESDPESPEAYDSAVGRLEKVLLRLRESAGPTEQNGASEDDIHSASVDELLHLIDEEFDLA